jgi:guanosine-3',5'-bis(diphosphate) 3'-pyrophosphohydrolase
LAPLEKAFRFALKYHQGQSRDSGEPYMMHPLMVAHILADMRMDIVAMVTGLLHDVVEDTSVTVEQVRKEFGEEVARCVDGVTKLSKLDFYSAEDRQAESFRKMLLAMVEDIRVILVKLADRMHNMRTLGYLSPERRERIARETIEIYAPIAHRLGMGKIRGELEDLALQHLEPDAYQEILRSIESRRHSNEEFLVEIRQEVEAELRREGHSGAHRRTPQAALLGLPEAAPPEDHRRRGVRPDGPAHRHRFGEELLRRARRDPQ